MQEELEKILTNLHDAGCGNGEVEKAKQLYESGDTKALENAGAVGWKNSTRVSGKWTAWIS